VPFGSLRVIEVVFEVVGTPPSVTDHDVELGRPVSVNVTE
jgi:hypothetical protein